MVNFLNLFRCNSKVEPFEPVDINELIRQTERGYWAHLSPSQIKSLSFEDKKSVFILAIKINWQAVIPHLLASGLSIDMPLSENMGAALHLAVRVNQEEMVRFLIGSGADQNVKLNELTPLHLAICLNVRNIVRYLATHSRDLQVLLPTALGSPESLQELLSFKLDIFMLDKRLFSLLHLAAWHGLERSVKILIDHAAKLDEQEPGTLKRFINLKNDEEQTALHIASSLFNESIIALLAPLSDVEAEDERRNTPMLLLYKVMTASQNLSEWSPGIRRDRLKGNEQRPDVIVFQKYDESLRLKKFRNSLQILKSHGASNDLITACQATAHENRGCSPTNEDTLPIYWERKGIITPIPFYAKPISLDK